jgi:hypothetical protein
MLFRPSTKTKFRNAAIGAGLVTLAAVSSFPANAQQAVHPTPINATTDQVTLTTDCNKWRPNELGSDIKCEKLKGQLLDAQAKMLTDEKTCLTKLLEFKKAAPEKFKELGPVTRANACEAASRIPKPTAEAAPRVGG